MSTTSPTKPTPTRGAFLPGEMLTLVELKRRTGWEKAALQAARRKGLAVRRFGNQRFVMADDFIKFVLEHGQLTGT